MRLMVVWSKAKEWVEQRFPIDEDFRLSTESETVEFIGGPLDGYEHCVDSVLLYHLPVDLAGPVDRESIRQLDACSLDPSCQSAATLVDPPGQAGLSPPLQSVVFYYLVQKGTRWQYHFESQRPGWPTEMS